LPPILTIPDVGLSRQPIMFMQVDFPDPDGPIIERNSPCLTEKETPRSACTFSSPIMYVFFTSLINMTFSPIEFPLGQSPPESHIGGIPPPIGPPIPPLLPLLFDDEPRLNVFMRPLFDALD